MKLLFGLFLAILFTHAYASAVQGQTRRTTPPAKRSETQSKTPAPSPTPVAKPSSGVSSATPAAATSVVAKPAPFDECGCEPRALPDVLATVNGVQITPQDIRPAAREQIDALKKQVVEARSTELDLQINSRLLDAEARKRGTTTAKLLEQEIVAKAKTPTETEARSFYDQNRSRITAEFEQVKAQVIDYLYQQRQQEAAKSFAERLRAASDVKVNVQKPTAPVTDAERARVFAVVNGQPITSGDIEDSLKPLIGSVQEQVYIIRKQEVDMKINDLLLEEDARKRGVTMKALLDAEIGSKLTTVTETDARKFYDENKARINGEFAQVKYQVIQFLEDQARQRAEVAYAQRLRNAASVQTFIRPPEPFVYQVTTDDQPSKGATTATVTLVEFTDFQCPSCAQTQPVIDRLAAEYGDRVRIVVRDFPLAQHENAFKAAEAAEAAREQGKYWEYVALLFKNQSSLDVANLKQFATSIGLDRARFDGALDSGKFAEKVQRDLLEGQKLGLSGTPTIFINGRRISDRTYEGLKLIIEDALKNPKK